MRQAGVGQMAKEFAIVGSHEGFLLAEVTTLAGFQSVKLFSVDKQPVEDYLPQVAIICDKFVSLDEAAEFCSKSKEVEKLLRPFWQAALEHQTRVQQMMLDVVYSTAMKKDS